VRVRENAESIAFYGGEESEAKLLFQRLGAVVANYGDLLVTSRNLSFFTSFYRWIHKSFLNLAIWILDQIFTSFFGNIFLQELMAPSLLCFLHAGS
jgi:ABC-type uncharacterized transport system fused permease/ATPase subunit